MKLTQDALRTLWNYAKPKEVGEREHLSLATYDGMFLLHEPDGYRVSAEYWRTDRYDNIVRESYRHHWILIPEEILARMEWRRSHSDVVEHLIGLLRYLVAIVRPTPRPKGWRLLNRHAVIMPGPKPRSRLRCKA